MKLYRDLVNIANEKGLLPDKFQNLGGMINLANYILDSELPEYMDEDYNKELESLGKNLFLNRIEILKTN